MDALECEVEIAGEVDGQVVEKPFDDTDGWTEMNDERAVGRPSRNGIAWEQEQHGRQHSDVFRPQRSSGVGEHGGWRWAR
eukprot:353500-Chlamydomonas_euryale.AAC.1